MTIPVPLKQSVKLSWKTKITSCPEKLYVLAQLTAITTHGCPDGGSFPLDPCTSTQTQPPSSFAGQMRRKQLVPTRRSHQLLLINVHLRSSAPCSSILFLTVTVNGGFSYPQFTHFLICKIIYIITVVGAEIAIPIKIVTRAVFYKGLTGRQVL